MKTFAYRKNVFVGYAFHEYRTQNNKYIYTVYILYYSRRAQEKDLVSRALWGQNNVI